MASDRIDADRTGTPNGPRPKKPYQAPILRRFGLVRDLTTGGSGIDPEMKMMTHLMRHP